MHLLQIPTLFMASASVFLVVLVSFLLFFSVSSTLPRAPQPSTDSIPPQIHQACAATRYPEACESSLIASKRVPPNPKPIDVVQSALWVSLDNLKMARSMVKEIMETSAGNPNQTRAAKNCLEVLYYSESRMSTTVEEALPRGKMKDARAWMSAALHYQFGCWSGLKYASDDQQVNKTRSFLDSLIELSSNALSMMESYHIFRDDMGSWRPPKTERGGFWEPAGSAGEPIKGRVPTDLPLNATVCKTGEGGCYMKVQEAVAAAPANISNGMFVIRIREGVYEETVRIPFEKKNIVFLGDGMGKTVITGSLNVGQPGISTYNTATVGVSGDGFMASGVTFQNTGGPKPLQAVAFRSDSDLSVIENCEFLGNQDTLYAHSLRQFYKSCHIQGNVDFIFGNAAAVFQDCHLQVRPRQAVNLKKGEVNAVTAQGRADPAQTTGFVFHNCSINGTEEYMKSYHSNPLIHKNFLGRPWKEYSRAVFIRCFFEALIMPEGWTPWTDDFALNTLFYGEFENAGPGANVSARVKWSSQIPAQHINSYSVQNFIQGDEWIPLKLTS